MSEEEKAISSPEREKQPATPPEPELVSRTGSAAVQYAMELADAGAHAAVATPAGAATIAAGKKVKEVLHRPQEPESKVVLPPGAHHDY